MLTPKTIGMACTDELGRLYFDDNGKKRLIARHPKVPDWVAPLDFSLLKRFLDLHWKNGTLVVIGPNTYQEAKRLLESHNLKKRSTIMISHPEHYSLVDYKGTGDPIAYAVDDSLAGLRIAARQVSLDRSFKQILVMGGRSVYGAFAGHYDHFTHCKVVTNESLDSAPSGTIDTNDLLFCSEVAGRPPFANEALCMPEYEVSTPVIENGYCVTQFQRLAGQRYIAL